MPGVAHDKAQDMAEIALKTEANVDMTNYKLIEDGSIEQAHRPDEFCALSELDACEKFLRKVIGKASV